MSGSSRGLREEEPGAEGDPSTAVPSTTGHRSAGAESSRHSVVLARGVHGPSQVRHGKNQVQDPKRMPRQERKGMRTKTTDSRIVTRVQCRFRRRGQRQDQATSYVWRVSLRVKLPYDTYTRSTEEASPEKALERGTTTIQLKWGLNGKG